MKAEVFYGNRITQHDIVDFTMMVCGGCGIPYMIPTSRYNELRNNKGGFYCPNGCSRVFTGKSDAEKFQEQMAEMKRTMEQEAETLRNRIMDEIQAKRKVELKLKRVSNGVCPCCNRTFGNLARHMKTKHPEIAQQPSKK